MTLDNFDERIKSLTEKGQARKVKSGSENPPAQKAQDQLKKWPEYPKDRRAAPAGIFRSALFPATGHRTRLRLWDETIYSTKGLLVTFRGEQFDQSDLDVYLEIVHLMQDDTGTVEFTAQELLKALGRTTGKHDYEWLQSVIIRLTANKVEIIERDTRFFGHLIDGGSQDEKTKKYEISMNSKFCRLFQTSWSSLDIELRRCLKSYTAKALHAFYSSHANPGKHLYETLAGICGLTNSNPRQLKASLIKAHKELEQTGFILAMDIEKDGIKIKATLTKSQAQYLRKKRIK